MFDLYMSKGIFPQTSPQNQELQPIRSNSENRKPLPLSDEEIQRKIAKQALIAKHVGPAVAVSTMSNFKSTMVPKQNFLKSNFAEYSGATLDDDSKYIDELFAQS